MCIRDRPKTEWELWLAHLEGLRKDNYKIYKALIDAGRDYPSIKAALQGFKTPSVKAKWEGYSSFLEGLNGAVVVEEEEPEVDCG